MGDKLDKLLSDILTEERIIPYAMRLELFSLVQKLRAELTDTKEDLRKMERLAGRISGACMYSPPVKEENTLIEPCRCTHKDTESGICLIEECPLQK